MAAKKPLASYTGVVKEIQAGDIVDPTVLPFMGGDGSDGDVTISGNTTLIRDMYYNTLTVNNGVTLITGGFVIYAKVSVTNNGTIARNGNAASGHTAGATLANGTLGGGTAGGTCGGLSAGGGGGGAGVIVIVAKSIVNNGTIQANGGAGGGALSGGGAFAGAVGTASTAALGGAGGKGGKGDASYDGANGGALSNNTCQDMRSFLGIRGWYESGGAIGKFLGGTGGGSGGQGLNIGNNGGGGGGGGGYIFLIYASITVGTIQVNGGAGGAKYGAGDNGATGSNGKILQLAMA